MSEPITVTTDLSKILDRIDGNLNDFRKETNQKLEKIAERLTKIEVAQARLESDVSTLKEDVKEIKGSSKAQIWTLIGILGTAVIGTVIRFVITAFPSNP
ncbi:hemolysin XhlA family protein [Crocosphaera sp. UHCC 0190]|uniref:hemolysin XhlA family protein n=1 Tax=Crocosphaera sp. UHCC 0190 TaxID=3110246 RepID=UPI002B209844|nr:hemolysin XhlA family protein [Crocosphaera sp. UHCC 0190]MEA5508720.1 hemolysin XhlA family protein [Crocosphaera sp. UHCC 0190]